MPHHRVLYRILEISFQMVSLYGIKKTLKAATRRIL